MGGGKGYSPVFLECGGMLVRNGENSHLGKSMKNDLTLEDVLQDL